MAPVVAIASHQVTSFRRQWLAVALGPALGLLWDPPCRLLEYLFDAPRAAATAVFMGVSVLLPLLCGL